VESPQRVLLAGLLYTIGRVVAYLGLAFLLVTTALSVPHVSMFLQKYMQLALGPMLILLGMLLVGLIEIRLSGCDVSAGFQQRVQSLGVWGALVLGLLFALAFCPTSAALFFGSVVSAVKTKSTVALPLVYGIGTALPVLVFAFIIALSAKSVGKAFNALSKVEWWARVITGWVIIVIGIGMTWRAVIK
jgi:cytochrome c biogenesis protein CcdA